MNDGEVQTRQISIPHSIVFRLAVMTAAIYFNHDRFFSTVKIHNIFSCDFLSFKIQS